MQNYKIKKMSDKELKEQLKAVGSLLYYYQKGKDFPDDCPLCDVAGEYHPRCSRTCDYCLWEIIEDEDCSDFSYRKFKKIESKEEGGPSSEKEGMKGWYKFECYL